MSRFLLNHGIMFIAGLGHGTFVAGVITRSKECLGLSYFLHSVYCRPGTWNFCGWCNS